jgi:4-amino-4-deoxy-L-arabinose transferase-like glycosyltransferase
LAAIIAVPWHAFIAMHNHGFLDHYFLREHILRFVGKRFPVDENVSAPLFLIITFIWTFPWIALLPVAVVDAFRRIKSTKWSKAEDLLPLVWFFLVICLFTASRSRLEYYSLPAIPAVALLMGKMWDQLLQGRMGETERNTSRANKTPLRSTMIVLGSMSAILALAAVASHVILGPSKDAVFRLMASAWPESGWMGTPHELVALERIHIPTVVVLTGSALCMLSALIAVMISRPRLACGLLAGMMAPIFILVHWGFLVMEPFQSSKPVAELLKRVPPLEVIVFQEPREYSWISGIVFYSKRMVHVLKDPRFDSDKSRHREPAERFLDQEDLVKLWQSGKCVALVMDHESEDQATKLSQCGPVDELGSLGTRVIVATGLPLRAAGEGTTLLK